MAVLELYTFPHKILSEKCEDIEVVDDKVRKLLDDMLETMYHSRGVGLAGPQVGVAKRILVIDDKVTEDGKPGANPLYMVNPRIVERSEEMVLFNEGCLSVPGQSAEVERHESVVVEYLDYYGKPQRLVAEDFLAIIVQHETDHLDGVLYIDKLSRLKRNMIIKRLEKSKA